MKTNTKTTKTAKTNSKTSKNKEVVEKEFTASEIEAKRKFVYQNRKLLNITEVSRELNISQPLMHHIINGVRRDFKNAILFCEDKINNMIAELQKSNNVPNKDE